MPVPFLIALPIIGEQKGLLGWGHPAWHRGVGSSHPIRDKLPLGMLGIVLKAAVHMA